MRDVLAYRLADGTRVALRPALPEDAAAVIAAVRSGSEERSYVLMEIYGKDEAALRSYIEGLDREHNLLLAAVANGGVVGILALLDKLLCAGPGPGGSVGLHLAREWRGRGIGSAMLRYASRWAQAHGYRRIEANIFTTNRRSLHVFVKNGFKEDACRRRSVQFGARQINEVILAKNL